MNAETVDFIIFSYDRPLQLLALLESIEKYVTDVGKIQIIYRVSTQKYAKAYREIAEKFKLILFVKQGDNPHSDFEKLTLQAIRNAPSHYLMFAVDDNVVKDYVVLSECVTLLTESGAYGFFLRIGKNTNNPNRPNLKVYLPELEQVMEHIFKWDFANSESSWNYPNNVDMTIYPKKVILNHLNSFHFRNPNTLEATWSAIKPSAASGLCFDTSKMINIPLNRIQTDCPHNPSMNFATPAELLEVFEKGMKIDISKFHQLHNNNPFQHIVPTYISRN